MDEKISGILYDGKLEKILTAKKSSDGFSCFGSALSGLAEIHCSGVLMFCNFRNKYYSIFPRYKSDFCDYLNDESKVQLIAGKMQTEQFNTAFENFCSNKFHEKVCTHVQISKSSNNIDLYIYVSYTLKDSAITKQGFKLVFDIISKLFLITVENKRQNSNNNLIRKIIEIKPDLNSRQNLLFKDLCHLIKSEFDDALCSIFLYNRYSGKLISSGTTGFYDVKHAKMLDDNISVHYSPENNESWSCVSFNQKKIICVDDIHNEKDYSSIYNGLSKIKDFCYPDAPFNEKQIRSFICSPLTNENDEVVGIIRLTRLDGKPFFPTEMQRFKDISKILGVKLEKHNKDFLNVTLYKQSKELHSRIPEAIDKFSKDGKKNAKAALESIADFARKTCGADAISIFIYNEDENLLKMIVDSCEVNRFDINESNPIVISTHETSCCVQSLGCKGEPVMISEVDRQENYRDLADKMIPNYNGFITKSEACIAVVFGEKILGVINFDSHEAFKYSEDDSLKESIKGIADIFSTLLLHYHFCLKSRVPANALLNEIILHNLKNNTSTLNANLHMIQKDLKVIKSRNHNNSSLSDSIELLENTIKKIETSIQFKKQHLDFMQSPTFDDKNVEPYDVLSFANECLINFKAMAISEGRTLRIMFSSPQPNSNNCQWHTNKMHEVLFLSIINNLLLNSFLYSPKGSAIELYISNNDDNLSLDVKNNCQLDDYRRIQKSITSIDSLYLYSYRGLSQVSHLCSVFQGECTTEYDSENKIVSVSVHIPGFFFLHQPKDQNINNKGSE
ncbi:MAG: GAF domain-containing protein [Gemmataceae bacterium]